MSMNEFESNMPHKWMMILGIVGIASLVTLGACSKDKIVLPSRLSCGVSQAPSVWEDGKVQFDFDSHVMTSNGARRRLYSGTKGWTEGSDRLIAISGFVDVASGSVIQKSDIIRVHPVERSGDGTLRVNVSGTTNSGAQAMELRCLGST